MKTSSEERVARRNKVLKDNLKKIQRHIIAVPTKEIAVAAKAACAFFRGYHETFIEPPSSLSPSWNIFANDIAYDEAMMLTHIADGVFYAMHELEKAVTA